MLTVHGRRDAFNVQKVMWLVGELGLPHRHVPRGGSHGGLDDPKFRALNPNGRVPVVEDGGAVVWESHAVLRYLAARHGADRFWPADPAARSLADRWMDWAQTTLQPDFLQGVFWGWFRTPEAERDAAKTDAAIARCAEHARLLDRELAARRWLGGDDFGLADIPAGTAMFRYFGLDIPRPEVPRLEDWYRRLQDRPAYREHVMIPFGHLKGRLAH